MFIYQNCSGELAPTGRRFAWEKAPMRNFSRDPCWKQSHRAGAHLARIRKQVPFGCSAVAVSAETIQGSCCVHQLLGPRASLTPCSLSSPSALHSARTRQGTRAGVSSGWKKTGFLAQWSLIQSWLATLVCFITNTTTPKMSHPSETDCIPSFIILQWFIYEKNV